MHLIVHLFSKRRTGCCSHWWNVNFQDTSFSIVNCTLVFLMLSETRIVESLVNILHNFRIVTRHCRHFWILNNDLGDLFQWYCFLISVHLDVIKQFWFWFCSPNRFDVIVKLFDDFHHLCPDLFDIWQFDNDYFFFLFSLSVLFCFFFLLLFLTTQSGLVSLSLVRHFIESVQFGTGSRRGSPPHLLRGKGRRDVASDHLQGGTHPYRLGQWQ